MPSQRKQFNFRLAPETNTYLGELVASVSASTGLEVSKADVIRLALIELRKRYPPLPKVEPEPEAKPRRQRKTRKGTTE